MYVYKMYIIYICMYCACVYVYIIYISHRFVDTKTHIHVLICVCTFPHICIYQFNTYPYIMIPYTVYRCIYNIGVLPNHPFNI